MGLVTASMAGFPAVVSASPPPRNVLEVTTVPPMPSARFSLDGEPLVTDDKGVTRAEVRRSRNKHQLQLLTTHLDVPGGSAEFIRWVGHGQGFTPSIPGLVITRQKRIQAVFQTTRTVHYTFVDQARKPVAPDRITSLSIRSDSGQHQTLPGARPSELTAVRPVLQAGFAVSKEVTYYLQSVIIDGTNVVNAGEQRLMPNRTTDATFVVLLRSVHVHVRDWLFSNPLAARIDLTYPDGRTERLPVDPAGDLGLENLARGRYRVRVAGPGYAPPREIALSRSQYAELTVLTYVDMVTLVGTTLATLAVLIAVGMRRPHKAKRART